MLLRAMVPLPDAPKVHLAGEPVLIISGRYDPIVSASNSAQLAAVLMNAGATVRTRALPMGPRAVADGSGHVPRLVKSKLRKACRRRYKIDHYETENSLLHSLRAREIFFERYSGQSSKGPKANRAIGPDFPVDARSKCRVYVRT